MIEKIVRPFETLDVTPPERFLPAPVPEVLVRITPGIVGTTRTFQGTSNHTTTYYMDAKHKEKKP